MDILKVLRDMDELLWEMQHGDGRPPQRYIDAVQRDLTAVIEQLEAEKE